MTINDLYKGLKARQFVPVYLLQGDEPLLHRPGPFVFRDGDPAGSRTLF